MSSPSPLHRLATQHFDERYKHKQSESFLSQPEHTIWVQGNFENPIFTFGCFSLKTLYNSCKLQILLQVAKFLFMHSFTHINIVFLFRHLCTEIVIFVNVCYQMKCFLLVIVFPFLGTGFANISPILFWFQWGSSNKVLKDIKIFWTEYLRPFIRYQGKNLDLFWIWCCFQFFLHCFVQPNQVIHFLFQITFTIGIRLWIFQTVNFFFNFKENSQLALCMLLKYCPLKFS